MPTVNVAELDRLEAWIDEQHLLPEGEREWNQETWRAVYTEDVNGFCGTTYCAAGRVVAWHDAQWPDGSAGSWVQLACYVPNGTGTDVMTFSDRTMVAVDAAAAQILGLLPWERRALFFDAHDYDAVKSVISQIRERARTGL